MNIHSCGIIPYRQEGEDILVLLGHMGGPFWSKKDAAGWSIIKGEVEEGETELEKVALREFAEETGYTPVGNLKSLGAYRQPSGKIIHAWYCEESWDLVGFHPGYFEMEWPKGTGNMVRFPEIDKIEWFTLNKAKKKLVKGQVPILEAFASYLGKTICDDFNDEGGQQGTLF